MRGRTRISFSHHAPEVECLFKGKAHKEFEFGVKVSVTTTNRDNFVMGIFAEYSNSYDGHTLARAIEQVQRVTGRIVQSCIADRGCRGHGINDTEMLISGRKRGMAP